MTATKTTTNKITETFYSQSGVVIGKLYGGGKGMYNARNFSADTKEELKAKIQKAFDLGSLDSGFGFEKLLAAGVQIVTERQVTIDGLVYTNHTYENYIVGDEDLFLEAVDNDEIADNLPMSEVEDDEE